MAAGPIDKAVSAADGAPLEALDAHLMLRQFSGGSRAGEMLDGDAPGGCHLLARALRVGSGQESMRCGATK